LPVAENYCRYLSMLLGESDSVANWYSNRKEWRGRFAEGRVRARSITQGIDPMNHEPSPIAESPIDPSLEVWLLADAYTVKQAACLWAGENPEQYDYRRSETAASRIAAISQMLSAAIQTGGIKADSSRNIMQSIGDFSKSVVTKVELQNFARSKGQFPAFLFNTLMPDQPESPPPVPEPLASGEPDSPASKKQGGRPPEYDWNAFTIEIIRVADLDGLPEKQVDLIGDMLQWCENTWGRQPAESSVKDRISRIYNGLGRGRKPPDV